MKYQVVISPVTHHISEVADALRIYLGPNREKKINYLIKYGGIVLQDLNEQTATNLADQLRALEVFVQIIDLRDDDDTTQRYLIKLLSAGDTKTKVVKVVKDLTGLSLKDAKELVDNLVIVTENLSKEEAERFALLLEKAGAEVRIEGFEIRDDETIPKYLIRLLSARNSKLKIVRDLTGLSRKDAENLVDNLSVITRNLSFEEAERIALLLEEVRIEVSIEEM